MPFPKDEERSTDSDIHMVMTSTNLCRQWCCTAARKSTGNPQNIPRCANLFTPPPSFSTATESSLVLSSDCLEPPKNWTPHVSVLSTVSGPRRIAFKIRCTTPNRRFMMIFSQFLNYIFFNTADEKITQIILRPMLTINPMRKNPTIFCLTRLLNFEETHRCY